MIVAIIMVKQRVLNLDSWLLTKMGFPTSIIRVQM
jgi:hypothetical protein